MKEREQSLLFAGKDRMYLNEQSVEPHGIVLSVCASIDAWP
jgi:hypothetical protein